MYIKYYVFYNIVIGCVFSINIITYRRRPPSVINQINIIHTFIIYNILLLCRRMYFSKMKPINNNIIYYVMRSHEKITTTLQFTLITK